MKSKGSLLLVIAIYAVLLLGVRMSGVWIARKGLSVPPGCSEELMAHVKNRTHARVASIIKRSCDATTDFVQSIYVDRVGGRDYEHASAVANGSGISYLTWEDDLTVIVHYYPNDTKFFQQESSAGDVRILYQALGTRER